MKLAFKKTRYWRPLIAMAALLVVLMAQPALAATVTWVGPVSNTNWSNPKNWDSNPNLPASGDDVFLTSTTGSKTATLNTKAPAAGSF